MKETGELQQTVKCGQTDDGGGRDGKKRRKMSERGRKKAWTEEGTVMGGKNSNKDNTKVGGETCKTKKKTWKALCAHVNFQAELHTRV